MTVHKAHYGAREAHLNTVTTLIGSPAKERPQEICTPVPIRTAIRMLWPEGLALDPCSAPGSILEAERTYFIPVRYEHKPTKKSPDRMVAYYKAQGPLEQDGLTLPWTERTYVNPPFKLLEAWLDKFVRESDKHQELLMLCPIRLHRGWMRDAWKRFHRIALDPFEFIGYDQVFTEGLCLLYHGERSDLFVEAFWDMGDVV